MAALTPENSGNTHCFLRFIRDPSSNRCLDKCHQIFVPGLLAFQEKLMESACPISPSLRLLISLVLRGVALARSCLPAFSTQNQSERWLEVQRLSGNVVTQINQHRQAQIGDRLMAPGHGIMTNPLSSADLFIDLGLGFLAVAQNTQMLVQPLAVLADGSRVTVLNVPQGQVRIQTRSFTHAIPAGTAYAQWHCSRAWN